MSTLIQISDLSKSYGPQVIFNKASLVVHQKHKLGIIGRNGAGKSTLFKIIMGEEEADLGEIKIYNKTNIGYLEQHDPYDPSEKVIDFLCRYTKKESWECGKVAAHFQLKQKELNSAIQGLSGGYQMRVKMTAMLLQDPNVLLLDEPTNFLDLSTLLLLEKFLKTYKGGHMIISHDREFLKRTCTETLEVEQGQLVLFPQPLEKYLEHKETQIEMKLKHNKQIELKRKQLEKFVERFRAKASKARQAQSKIKQINRLNPIEIKHMLGRVSIKIPKTEERRGPALDIKNMIIGYPEKEVARNISFTVNRNEHIAIVGDNGQGKTTFLKTLIGELNPLSGEYHFVNSMNVGYYAQHVPERIDKNLTVYEYLDRMSAADSTRESLMEMAGNFLFQDDDLKKQIKILSGGEKSRLCLAGLLLKEYNCLFLDEPSNHLDFETVEALAQALTNYGGMLLFISHDRTFVDIVSTGVIEVKNSQVARYHGSYDDYVFQLENKCIQESKLVENIKEEEEDIPKPIKINQYQLKKDLKKSIRRIEKEIEALEKEKKEFCDWFKKNPTKYDAEKYKRSQEVENTLEKLESEWLKAQEALGN